jgi:hypothetical protein
LRNATEKIIELKKLYKTLRNVIRNIILYEMWKKKIKEGLN